MMDAPERIYLEPACCVSPMEGRQWCEDNVWPVDAASCEAMGIEYVRADLTRPLTGGVTEDAIEAGVKELRANLDLSEGLLDELEDDSNLHIALREAYLAMSNASRGG
jgi:hypothetical protein